MSIYLFLLLLFTYECSSSNIIQLTDDSIEFYANETYRLMRTPITDLVDYHTCLKYHYFVDGKRTRLNVYMCRMADGGRCILEHYRQTNNETRCGQMRAWMKTDDRYAFYFEFRRRPRFGIDDDDRRRRMRRSNRSHRLVGTIHIDGLVACNQACQ